MSKIISGVIFKLIQYLIFLLIKFLKVKYENIDIEKEIKEALNEEDRAKAADRLNALFK